MKTYARYKFNMGWEAERLGKEWHEVTKEFQGYAPSGFNNYVIINGLKIKASHCDIVQVF